MNSPDDERLLDLLVEWEEARQRGETRSAEELCPDDSALQYRLRNRIEQRRHIERMIEPDGVERNCDHSPSEDASTASFDAKPSQFPTRIGRYRRERLLGRGGFGLVYLAHDEQLNRPVAIKVPHPHLVSRPEDAEKYRMEARSVASLDHPHIVPVYDVGSSEQFPCFVVAKYIEGTSLAKRLKQSRPPFVQTAEWLATVAEALHFAHKRGFVHRDVKPANILISPDSEPFVIDFGLALRDQSFGDERRFAGTPAYMSPEQARGESHRVDGRSDVFGLGVVLYELLVGRRPFIGENDRELLSQVIAVDPKPPRQIDDHVPKELERICLKALSKRATERYTTAKDFADDLRFFLSQCSSNDSGRVTPASVSPVTASPNTPIPESETVLKIVPKGLRSFDEHDADFILDLLPGPRDRDGLPDSVRLWKSRIEEFDSEKTFSVGLLYGPSGSGKSSLVKAGLLPRLSDEILTVYLEATPDETELRLLNSLRKRCPKLPKDLPLVESLAAIRSLPPSHGSPHKVLIVLDQFEQWLHVWCDRPDSELVTALRHCDGDHLQCLVLVRDDFWMAATRFMRELEIPLVEGFNSNAVDLFPIRHARKVLSAFGRAFGALPDRIDQTTPEQVEFVNRAVSGLAPDGYVISVRLALFAEMMKSKPWVPATLQEIGGTEGVGLAFLEATFSGSSAPPSHRIHQRAARAVLASLLPEAGIDIKGHVRPRSQLMEVSGYARQPQDLAELLRILDNEVRLITPVDRTDDAAPESSYQLTHDYLVPALRDWLTRKQRETRRGRAELQLVERSSNWNAKPDNRLLPTLGEFISIYVLTRHAHWTASERKMMSRAARWHLSRWLLALALLIGGGLAIQQFVTASRNKQIRAALDAVQLNLVTAVPAALQELKRLPREATLREIRSRETGSDVHVRLRLACATAELGEADMVFLCSQIGSLAWDEVDLVVSALEHVRDQSLDNIRTLAAAADMDRNWHWKSRLAIVALHLGDDFLAIDMCQIANRPDPIQRTWFVEQLINWQGDLIRLAEIARPLKDSALRSALCIGLSGIVHERLTPNVRNVWQPIFTDWFLSAPDSVTHSSAGLPMIYWGLPVPQVPVSEPTDSRDWFVCPQMLTLLRLPQMSNHPSLDTSQTVFLSDREIANWQFLTFLKDSMYPADLKPERIETLTNAHPFLPINGVSWDDCVMYCNWLNQKAGHPPCYEKTRSNTGTGINGWQLIPGRNGFRMPAESEWELACRAGTNTEFSFGDGSFYPRYANVQGVGIQAVAVKIPNGWGFFDMHGNVAEWCHQSAADTQNQIVPEPVIRDGGWLSSLQASSVTTRKVQDPHIRLVGAGFRVAWVSSQENGKSN